MKKKISVMGIGNLLFSDEGIGIHAAQEMEKWDLPENISVFDAGTLGILSAPLFEEYDLLVLIDAVEAEGKPGDVFKYSKEDIMLDKFPMKLSPHQIGFQETLLISELRGKCPPEVIFYGAIPESLETSIELTETGKKALAKILEEMKKLFAEYS